MRPYALRPFVLRLAVRRLFSGVDLVTSSRTTYVRYRRAGDVGFRVRLAIAQAPSTSSILWPGASCTTAFFQFGRRPWCRPIRFNLPSYEEVRTSLTFTLKTRSTAIRISTLLASGCTWKVTTLPSSFWRMLFSVMMGLMMTARGSRVTVTSSARPARAVGGLPEVRGAPFVIPIDSVLGASFHGASFGQRLLKGEERAPLEERLAAAQELIHRHVGRRLDRQPRHVARRPGDRFTQRLHDEQRRHRGQPPAAQLGHERLRLAVADL